MKKLFFFVFILNILNAFLSCTKPAGDSSDSGNSHDSTIVEIPKRYFIDKVAAGPSTTSRLFYYDSSNKLVAVAHQYSPIISMSLYYDANSRVKKVIYAFDHYLGPYTNGSDSMIYGSDNKIHLIVRKRDTFSNIDTLNYNSSGLLSSIVDDQGGSIYRTNLYYDVDSNLIEYTNTRYCYTPLEEKVRDVIYGNYDTISNPFHKLAGDNVLIPDIYDYSEGNLDGEDYTQLSKNNPGYIKDYQTGSGGVYLNGMSNLIYTYDSAKTRPVSISTNYYLLHNLHYVFK